MGTTRSRNKIHLYVFSRFVLYTPRGHTLILAVKTGKCQKNQ